MGNTKQYKTLVTAGEVISKTFTNKNTDPVLVSENTLVLSELAHLRPLLGDKFYAELKNQHNTGDYPTVGGLSQNNQNFMDYYLEDCLCWFTRFEVVNDIMSNITSSGVVHNLDEFSNVITPSDYNAFKQDTYRKAEIFANDMIDYLNGTDQAGMFPTYEANKPNKLHKTYKNHGMIFYDSIYGYNGIEGCFSCGVDYVNGNCNCGCNDC
tara:strand:- start:9455 stop:10084 length:630 start_codon:yes stop_codon:yes gene_type:complete